MTDKEITENNKTELKPDDLVYGIKEPRKSCKHCHGEGREGWDNTGEVIICRCLSREGAGEWITVAAFREICSKRRYHEGPADKGRSDEVSGDTTGTTSKEST